MTPLEPAGGGAPGPAPDRLYGRQSGHRLRARQRLLIERVLPRFRFAQESAAEPFQAFAAGIARLRFEVGFGGGEHAAAVAAAHPDDGLIAAEVFVNGICSLLSRLVPEGQEAVAEPPANLLLWDKDARTLLRRLPDTCLETVFLMFPDPWPKSRHAKRRFVGVENVTLLARVLRPGGEWRIASDDPTYQSWVRTIMAGQDLFGLAFESEERPPDWPPTRYEAKARRAGRVPIYWSYVRQ